MVRLSICTVLAGLAATSVVAQPADWRHAGGGLFFATASIQPPAAASGAAAITPPLALPSQPFDTLVGEAALSTGLDPKLLHALVTVESGYRPNAQSTTRTGEHAGGLTQLMPSTARDLGVEDRFDPAENLSGGARYLAAQLQRFGDLRLALAAYNAGPERVARLGRIPRIPETEAYVVRVVECYLALTAGRSIRSARDCQPTGATP